MLWSSGEANASQPAEPIHPIPCAPHNVGPLYYQTLWKVKSVKVALVDLGGADGDVLQRMQHGATVIHLDVESSRSALVHLRLDASAGLLLWERFPAPARAAGREPDEGAKPKKDTHAPKGAAGKSRGSSPSRNKGGGRREL